MYTFRNTFQSMSDQQRGFAMETILKTKKELSKTEKEYLSGMFQFPADDELDG